MMDPTINNVCLPIQKGDIFRTIAEIESKLVQHSEEKFVQYYKRESRTIEAGRKKTKRYLNPALEFYQVKWACIRGGRDFVGRGKGIRQTKTLRKEQPCQSHISVIVSNSGLEFVVSEVDYTHNHIIAEDLYESPSPQIKKSPFREEEPIYSDKPKMNFQAICRVCATEKPRMLSIFDSYNFSKHNCEIFKAIADCASVQIQKFDGFSEQICRRCLDHLSQAYSFKRLCEDSDYKFRNCLILNEEIEIKDEILDDDSINENIAENDFRLTELSAEHCDEIKTETECYNDPFIKKEEELSPTSPSSDEDQEASELNNSQCIENDASDDSDLSHKSELSSNKHLVHQLRTLEDQPTEVDKDNKFDLDAFKSGATNNCDNNIFIKEDAVECNTKNHTNENKYECEICGKSFSLKWNLVAHLKLHTGEKQYKCDICDKTFPRKDYLTKHLSLHSGKKQYKCDMCDKKFSLKSYLMKHISLHMGKKQYKCSICDKKFLLETQLADHVKLHSGGKQFKCDVCDKKFSVKSYLVQHIKLHTAEKKYKCDICFKKFTRNDYLAKHINSHLEEKQHKCEICDKKFSQKSNLAQHIKLHLNEKQYTCNVCDKKFSLKSYLMKHLSLHSGKKQYKSNICDEKFLLENNIKLHSGKKQFKCEICAKKFSLRSYLDTHIKLHTGEKQYKCDVCDKNFSQKCNLNKHIKLHMKKEQLL